MPLIYIVALVVVGGGALLYAKEKNAAAANLSALTRIPAGIPGGGSQSATAGGSTAVGEEEAGAISTATAAGADLATGNISGAVAAGISGLISQLTQHTARLKDATNENQAMDILIPQYDADLKAIAAAYNQGEINASQAATAIQTVNQQTYTYAKSQTGKPGTAFLDTGSQLGQPGKTCNAKCTVGCCVYYNDLAPGCFNLIAAISTAEGKPIPQNDGQTSQAASIPEVYPPANKAYGNYTRPLYTIQVQKASSISLGALSTIL